ncbi:hypothetical protein [Streptomyces sp. NPDC001594]|uniref:hypothetical protein n=1 Tax=Streptomyces sp. NPDC001594 TaxID=3364590 RepID=UPI0036754ECE
MFINTWVWLIILLVKHMAYGVEENEALTAPPLPSQCVTSVPTTPVEPVYSVEPSGLGEVPLILLPLDDVPVPMASLTPPPATRPPEQSAWARSRRRRRPVPTWAS